MIFGKDRSFVDVMEISFDLDVQIMIGRRNSYKAYLDLVRFTFDFCFDFLAALRLVGLRLARAGWRALG